MKDCGDVARQGDIMMQIRDKRMPMNGCADTSKSGGIMMQSRERQMAMLSKCCADNGDTI